MDHTYWHRQTADKPLFPDLLWSRPETRHGAGKLLIIGGHQQAFAAAATAYTYANGASVGLARVLLPDSLQKAVGKLFAEAEFAPSTPSGSFGRQALDIWLAAANWADGVLVAGDLGHNSETAILLEQFINKYQGQLTLVGDSLDYFFNRSQPLFERQQTVIVPSLGQLQKLMTGAHLPYNLSSSQQFVQHLDTLHQLTTEYNVCVILQIEQQVVAAAGGQISTTHKVESTLQSAAKAAVWWLQNPGKTFEALSSSVIS